MRFEKTAMQVPTGAGNGTAVLFERFTEKTVIVGGTFTATIRIQGSLDGTNYVDLTGDVTTPSVIPIPHTVKYLRVRTVAHTSTPAVSLGGFDGRSV